MIFCIFFIWRRNKSTYLPEIFLFLEWVAIIFDNLEKMQKVRVQFSRPSAKVSRKFFDFLIVAQLSPYFLDCWHFINDNSWSNWVLLLFILCVTFILELPDGEKFNIEQKSLSRSNINPRSKGESLL